MNTLKEILQNPASVLIDVRSPMEYNMDHIPGAKNIPLDQIPSRIDEFKKKSQPIVCYCRSGARSGMAVSMLSQQGMNDLYNGGGIDDLRIYLN